MPEESRSRESAAGEHARWERDLVRQAQAGNRAAFEELVRKHQKRVFAIVNGVLRRREDIEDVAQQVFIKVFLSLRRFDQRSAFSTWLYKIAVNECRDYLRKKRARPLVYEADLSEEQARQVQAQPTRQAAGGAGREVESAAASPTASAAVLDAEQRAGLRQIIERLLAELNEEDRMMLVMKEVEGYAVEEISEITGLNVNTVKVRLFRARGRLTEVYRRRMEKKPRSSAERAREAR